MPSISEVLGEFVSQAPARSREGDDANAAIADLFQSYLDRYGHLQLDEQDGELWLRKFEEDEEAGAFSKIFGPDKIPGGVAEFLSWFVIRKVLGPSWIAKEAGPVCMEMLSWLADKGYVASDEAEELIEFAAEAADQLPAADKLSAILYELTEISRGGRVLEDIDAVDGMSVISKIEPGKLWFFMGEGDVGPVRVPTEATNLARVGWEISACHFVRTNGGWHLIEMGNVYPLPM